MALAEILPSNVDRVLSLDSDTLVLDSIQEMYNTAFEKDQIVAGVYDCVGTAIQKRVLQASDSMKYCNAGVLLIDLKKKKRKCNVRIATKRDVVSAFVYLYMLNPPRGHCQCPGVICETC